MMPNVNNIAFSDTPTVFVHTCVKRRLLSGSTNRFDLRQFIRPRQQVFAAFKWLSTEVRSETVAKDRDIQSIHGHRQLEHLGWAEKLRLINQHTMHLRFTVGISNVDEQIVIRAKGIGLPSDSDAR